jgi:hypothetical protein
MRHVRLVTMMTALLAGAAVAAQSGHTLGAGVKLSEPTTIAALYDAPERFVGKTIRLDGVVTAVCEAMGCWMALADAEKSERTVRFKVDHGAAIVFPIAARGKRASAEGVLERIAADDHEANAAAREHATAHPGASDFGRKYQIKATGAVIR